MPRCRKYCDAGDWTNSFVGVIGFEDPRSGLAVLIHEIVEMALCRYYGIPYQEVDRDDLDIIAGRKKLRDCRYYRHHRTATKIERLICSALRLSWDEHDRNVRSALKRQEQLEGRRGRSYS